MHAYFWRHIRKWEKVHLWSWLSKACIKMKNILKFYDFRASRSTLGITGVHAFTINMLLGITWALWFGIATTEISTYYRDMFNRYVNRIYQSFIVASFLLYWLILLLHFLRKRVSYYIFNYSTYRQCSCICKLNSYEKSFAQWKAKLYT